MAWLALVALVVAAFAIPKFGKVMLVLLGVAVTLAIVGAVALYALNQREKAERDTAKNRISRSEIELADLGLKPSYGTGSYTLVGRVRNRSSRYALSELRLKLTMRDCLETSNCEVVGETEDTAYVNIPPGQARDLDEFVSFSGLKAPRGKHQWDWEVVEIVGR